MGALGWPFKPAEGGDFPGAEVDPLYNSNHIRDLYLKANPDFMGRFTVPVLWDKKEETIVNNESSEIIRIFNTAFNGMEGVESKLDLYPPSLQKEIDDVNAWVYDKSKAIHPGYVYYLLTPSKSTMEYTNRALQPASLPTKQTSNLFLNL